MENILIYHVDIGKWITCDFSILNKTVSELKLQIEKKTNIPVHKQVILVSGGTMLDASKIVSFYSAGTDTNPFFLFNKMIIDLPNPPPAYIDKESDIDFTQEHSKAKNMPISLDALNNAVSLAHQYSENSQCICNCIEILINDQYMMNQGWFAAVANMLDSIEKFKIKADLFESDFKRYLDGREDNIKLLNNFNDILLEISNIPLLPALVKNNSDDKDKVNNSTNNKKNIDNQSLLDWIVTCQGILNLENIIEHCRSSLKQFDEDMLNTVLQEISIMHELIHNNCSEIKGLEQRLFKLSQFLNESKLLQGEQLNLAEAIKTNHTKTVIEEVDVSVINVLLTSYDKQLGMMNKHNLRLCDIRNKCLLSKQELCENIYARLKWLIVIQNKISDLEAIMLLYSDNIKLIREYLDVFEQLRNTPKMYFMAVVEIIRRRIFSQALLIWSSDLACHMMSFHSDEIAKRKNFQCQFEGHFLNQLFSGLEDLPPAFATKAPKIFDYNLPKLCLEDLDELIKKLPEIACTTSIPNFNAITQFFLSKSIQENITLPIGNNENKSVVTSKEITDDMEEKFNEIISAIGINTITEIDMHHELDVIKRKHSEMENDNSNFILSNKCIASDQNSVKLLKDSIYKLKNIAMVAVNRFRSDLNIFKQCIHQQNLEIVMFTNDIKSKYKTQHSYINNLVQFIQESNCELDRMKTRIHDLELLLEIQIKREKYERQLRLKLENEKEYLKEKLQFARIEITNELTITHKEELDTLKKRFKIMTQTVNNIEESNLEKKRNNVIDLVNHESLMAQLREDLLLQNEQAILFHQTRYEQKKMREQKLDDQILCDDNKQSTEKYFKCQKDKLINEKLIAYCPKSGLNSMVLPEWDTHSMSSSIFVDLSKSSSSEFEEGKLAVNSFNVGDYVLIVWNIVSRIYVVYQENKKNLVFLHPDNINELSLKFASDEVPKIQHFSAEVIQKEYCQAVKENNRYKVKKGMKFYRIKIQIPNI